jgi:Uma2 family endonuclease
MVQRPAEPYVPFEDYLEAEQRSETKHEWLDGVVYAMGGGSIEHARLAVKMTSALTARLGTRCTVLSSDAMLYIRETNLATYPDATVVCGSLVIEKVVRGGKLIGEAITNPKLIVEVLSDSTQAYDRGEKFGHYMRIPSLEEYVLVAQDEPRIEVFRRPPQRGHWLNESARRGETVVLLGEPLPVDDVYGPSA